MKSILLIAHGSRRSDSNEEIRQLAETLRNRIDDDRISVSCAFLEQTRPSIPEAIDECVRNGARSILILPYFLSAGQHVSTDIPELIHHKTLQYPGISFLIRPHIGSAEAMADLLMSIVCMDEFVTAPDS